MVNKPAIILVSLLALAGSEAASRTAYQRPTAEEIQLEIAETPEKSGGIYFAYPETRDSLPPVPDGFKPVAISHYGRHGSRWALNAAQYPYVIDILQQQGENGNLTYAGEQILERVKKIKEHSDGNLGALTPVGERQHKQIAERLMNRFAELFPDTAEIEVYSSIVPRCIVSMTAFCERLKEMKPSLTMRRHVSDGNMDFIAYTSPEAKSLGSKNASWRRGLKEFKDSVIDPARFAGLLFKKPGVIANADSLMIRIHDIAIDLQDVEGLDVTLLEYFTPEELYNLWQLLNYNMYVSHANSATGEGAALGSAESLMRHMTGSIDKFIEEPEENAAVTLRFGHDTNLIRFASLLGIEGCDEKESDPKKFATAWQSYKVSPMGANLQIILFSNEKGEKIALVRLNEQPATFPIESYSDGKKKSTHYYEWTALKSFWEKQLKNLPYKKG